MQKVQYMPREGTNLDILCKYLNIARRNPVPLPGASPQVARTRHEDEEKNSEEKTLKTDILAVTL